MIYIRLVFTEQADPPHQWPDDDTYQLATEGTLTNAMVEVQKLLTSGLTWIALPTYPRSSRRPPRTLRWVMVDTAKLLTATLWEVQPPEGETP